MIIILPFDMPHYHLHFIDKDNEAQISYVRTSSSS